MTDSELTVGRHIGRFKSAISAAARPISTLNTYFKVFVFGELFSPTSLNR